MGVEVTFEDGRIVEISPQRGMPDPYILSVPFVNAHSHLEYRSLQGVIRETEYWPWIREITRLKQAMTPEEVRSGCELAVAENFRTGVGLIGEHSDQPGSALALSVSPLTSVLFQELITFNEQLDPAEKWESVQTKRRENEATIGHSCFLAPHAPYTVDETSLRRLAGDRISIHVAETQAENDFFLSGTGPIADFYQSFNFPLRTNGLSSIEYLDSLGLAIKGNQFVHCCAASDEDIEILAQSNVSVAHCPRSNVALGCPIAPIRRMLEGGIPVGLGLDSAASSGPIDMFAEMRAALQSAYDRGEPLEAEQVWDMATTMGAQSLGVHDWEMAVGYDGPLIQIASAFTDSIGDVIQSASPEHVTWMNSPSKAG